MLQEGNPRAFGANCFFRVLHRLAQVVEKARQQDAGLQKRQAQLKSQLHRFQKFVYTNEEKTTRANRRASAERETSHARDKEIAVLQRQLAVDEVTCKGFESQVQGRKQCLFLNLTAFFLLGPT